MLPVIFALASLAPSISAVTFRGWVNPKRYRKEGGTFEIFTEHLVDAEPGEQVVEEVARFEDNEVEWKQNLLQNRRSDLSFRGVTDCDLELETRDYTQHADALAEFGLGPTGNFINIGASDGESEDPLYEYMIGYNATGVMLEVAEEKCEILRKKFPEWQVKVLCDTVTPMNIVDLLRSAKSHIRGDLDVIKLDIDSYDAPVLEEILHAGYRPKHFFIEINPAVPPPYKFATQYHKDLVESMVKAEMWHWPLRGMSLSYAIDLLAKFDYDFVTFGAHDAVFVHKPYRRIYNFRTPFDEYDCYDKAFLSSNGFPIRKIRRWFYELGDKYTGIAEISEYINKYVAKNTRKTFPFIVA